MGHSESSDVSVCQSWYLRSDRPLNSVDAVRLGTGALGLGEVGANGNGVSALVQLQTGLVGLAPSRREKGQCSITTPYFLHVHGDFGRAQRTDNT